MLIALIAGNVVPLLIRFLILRKPVNKVIAIIIAFINLITINVLGILILEGRSSGVAMGSAIASIMAYGIMTSKDSTKTEEISNKES